VFYHQYPTEACDGSNPVVGSLRNNVTASEKRAADLQRETATASIKAVRS
jgi:hypothetical protein